MLLCEQSQHPKPFFHKRTDVFWLDYFSPPIKDQLITAALYAYAILTFEETQNLGREQLTDLIFFWERRFSGGDERGKG